MKRLLLPPLTILFALTIQARQAGGPAGDEAVQRTFVKVERVGDNKFRSFFMFSAGGRDYTIRADGRGEISRARARPLSLNLKVDGGHLEQVFFLEYGGDLLLIWEVSDGTRGWGYAARFSTTTAQAKWLTGVRGYAFGPALAESNNAYLTAAGFVAKLDLATGAYVWQQRLPAENDSPQVFGVPRVEGDRVLFAGDSDPQRTLVVDKLSGKIISAHE